MTESNQTNLTPPLEENSQESLANNEDSMGEYYQLQRTLVLGTLTLTGIIFPSIWWGSSLKIALSYLLGAMVGLVYLIMLVKDVEKLGGDQKPQGLRRMALFAGLMILSLKWQQLKIVPVLLGFLTYKLAIILSAIPKTLIRTDNVTKT